MSIGRVDLNASRPSASLSYSVASPEPGQVRAGGRLDIGRVHHRAPPHAYRGTFRVGEAAAVDGVEDTDGLLVVSAPLDPRYPMGLLVVQDRANLAPDGAEANQNFKLVSWRDVLAALNLGSPRVTSWSDAAGCSWSRRSAQPPTVSTGAPSTARRPVRPVGVRPGCHPNPPSPVSRRAGRARRR